MSSSSQAEFLDGRHRDTLLRLFEHPTSHNIEWQEILSLLEALGSVEPFRDGKSRARLGAKTEALARAKHKDIDVQQIVNLRRMLTGAGYVEAVEEMGAKGKEA